MGEAFMDETVTGMCKERYILDVQVGFLLRQASQRHAAIFSSKGMEDLTPTQWATIAKLHELGRCTQNRLGRHIAMDAATIKGVVDRLNARGIIRAEPCPSDARRVELRLSLEGERIYERLFTMAFAVSDETLSPLTPRERATFMKLLERLR